MSRESEAEEEEARYKSGIDWGHRLVEHIET